MRYGLFVLTMIISGSMFFGSGTNAGFKTVGKQKDFGLGGSSVSTGLKGSNDDLYKILETVTDSSKPVAQMSAKEKMNAHIVHFTGAVMSDTFVVSHFSRAFVADQYSDFLKPGKYNDGAASVPNAVASSLDGIAIPKNTRLIVYGGQRLTGGILLDVTGPAIVNNDIWMTSDFYSVANKKKFSGELQELFPQTVRKYTSTGNRGMSYWQNFSFEIKAIEQ